MLIRFEGQHHFNEDRIEFLWKMVRLAREAQDRPMAWKLTEPYLVAVGQFLMITDVELLVARSSFLDASLDSTSCDPRLVCEVATYPFSIFEPKSL